MPVPKVSVIESIQKISVAKRRPKTIFSAHVLKEYSSA